MQETLTLVVHPCMAAWGFTYVHHWIWDKEVAGTGYWGRDRHELLLIGRRGDPVSPLPGSQPETVYRERKGRHSAKPDYFAEQIERLYPAMPARPVICWPRPAVSWSSRRPVFAVRSASSRCMSSEKRRLRSQWSSMLLMPKLRPV